MHIHDVIPSPTLRSPASPTGAREKWDNNLEYYMAVLGFAAGFGSVWRFPYLVWKNGYFFWIFSLFIEFFLSEVEYF